MTIESILNNSKELAEKMRYHFDLPSKNILNFSKEAEDLRQYQYEHSIHITEKITPKLYRLFQLVSEKLFIPSNIVEGFVYASNDMQAECFSAHPENCAIRISSALIEKLTEKELSFVIGHEIGHFLLNHVRNLDQSTDHEGLIQKRAQEISSDRIGLWVCEDINIALSAIIKIVSGLRNEDLGRDKLSFMSQIKEVNKDFDRSHLSHPPFILRGRALFHFAISDFFKRNDVNYYDADQIKKIDNRIKRDQEDYIDNFSNYEINKLIENYSFWYVVKYTLQDKKLSKMEQSLIEGKFGKQKLKGLINLLSEYSQSELNSFLTQKIKENKDRILDKVPKRFNIIENEIKEFCKENL